MLQGDGHSSIVGHRPAVGIFRIDPDLVVVAAAPVGSAEGFAAIGGNMKRTVRYKHFVFIAGGDGDTNVVTGAADQRAVPVHDAPVLAGIVGAPQRALILGLDERVDATGISGSDCDIYLADRRLR